MFKVDKIAVDENNDLYQQKYEEIISKICLWEGLVSSTYQKYDVFKSKENKAVTICSNPNLTFLMVFVLKNKYWDFF